ncbi:MAG TPA: metallophosphoesterase family protein [Chitinophagales bacterium]|jgi:calcineurin-like phosphoesterase family protein|nr:metallophosphoesterase family protein [Chitinophagales bacterium]HMY41953.1 metallophosphoesterase family protein [Chitinophagales bacterium]
MKTFLIADTHFGHSNILTFKSHLKTGLLREGFNNINHHDEILIQNWNSVVSKNDKVYHLGDIGFRNFSSLSKILEQLNGIKVLIKGNHDNFKLSQYAQYFKDVRAYHILDKFILSHIPIHDMSLSRWKANIHGHLHELSVPDKRYYCVSVEQHNYTPVDFEYIRSIYKND